MLISEKIQNAFKFKNDAHSIPQRLYYYKLSKKMITNSIEIIFDFIEVIQNIISKNYPNGDLKSNPVISINIKIIWKSI